MANSLAPFGFAPVSVLDGTMPTYAQSTRLILRTNATAIYFGDPVVSLASGYITQATPGTTQIAGVFRGCKFPSPTNTVGITWSKFWPGSGSTTDVTAYYEAFPQNTYLLQANGQLLQSHVGMNANFALGTGNVATGLSGATLDVTTIATTATLSLRIVQLWNGINVGAPPGANGSDLTTPYGFAVVTFNNQDFKSLTGI